MRPFAPEYSWIHKRFQETIQNIAYLCDTNFDQFSWSFKHLLTVYLCHFWRLFEKSNVLDDFFFYFLASCCFLKIVWHSALEIAKARSCLIFYFVMNFSVRNSPLPQSHHLYPLSFSLPSPYSGRGSEVRGNMPLATNYCHLRFLKSFLHIFVQQNTTVQSLPHSCTYGILYYRIEEDRIEWNGME